MVLIISLILRALRQRHLFIRNINSICDRRILHSILWQIFGHKKAGFPEKRKPAERRRRGYLR
jgi:hypothetical protein